jgi:hypothetical protein
MNPMLAITKTWTVVSTAAQWLWNTALSANPIGLIIIAIAALVAGLVWFFTKTTLGRQIFASAMAGIAAAFNWMKDEGGKALGWITDKWNAFTGFITSIKAKISAIAHGMWDGITAAARTQFNAVAGLWNNTVGRISFSIPSWVPGIGGNGFSMPKIPYMADGGIVTGPTLAVLGEAGAEAVIPLSGGGAAGLGQTINVYVNNAVVGNEDAIQRVITDAVRSATGRGYGTAFG